MRHCWIYSIILISPPDPHWFHLYCHQITIDCTCIATRSPLISTVSSANHHSFHLYRHQISIHFTCIANKSPFISPVSPTNHHSFHCIATRSPLISPVSPQNHHLFHLYRHQICCFLVKFCKRQTFNFFLPTNKKPTYISGNKNLLREKSGS